VHEHPGLDETVEQFYFPRLNPTERLKGREMKGWKFGAPVVRAAFGLVLVGMVALPISVANARHAPAVKRGGTLVINPSPVGDWQDNFNPFGPATGVHDTYGSEGLIYEPLLYFNLLTSKITDMLATGYRWSDGGKALTFTIRKGVKWNDGKPFTPADVLFSVHLALKYAAWDTTNLGNALSSAGVTQRGWKVTFHFKAPNYGYLYTIGDTFMIVPKHIFSKVGDPTKFADEHPVGTGPFKVGSFSPSSYTLVANNHYWQAGKPYIHAIQFLAYPNNTAFINDASTGKLDWGGTEVDYASKALVKSCRCGNAYWYSPTSSTVGLYLNLAEAPFNNVWVRRAITEVINRHDLSKAGELGYESPANAGWIQPQYVKTWGVPSIMHMLNPKGNLKLAKADMKKAEKSASVRAALKKTFYVRAVDGWFDWDRDTVIIASNLKKIGINAVADDTDQFGAWFNDGLVPGHYDMDICWTNLGAPNPYSVLQGAFDPANYEPIGSDAWNGDWERLHMGSTGLGKAASKISADFAAFRAASRKSKQISAIKDIEKQVATWVPSVPLLGGAWWDDYNTSRFVGFPSAKNAYDVGSPYQPWTVEDVVLHLHRR
jgi:peptide/nickel transport system substrate-binding protein